MSVSLVEYRGMKATDSDTRTVLVVEDEDRVAEVFATILSDTYTVRLASDGAEALEKIDETVDVVLLDRQLPQMSGDEILERIEATGYDYRVAMISGVDPDFDVLDMGFDDYLRKPVRKNELLETVQRLLALDEYEEIYQKLSEKRIKRNIIELEKRPAALEQSHEFQTLLDEISELEAQLNDMEVEQQFNERVLPV